MQTGPRTPEGKARSAQNSFRHGLTSRQVVAPGESQQEFDDLQSAILAEHAPATPTENEMVEELAACAWRLRRARRIEAGNLEKIGTPEFDRILRYIGSIERAWSRAVRELTTARKERLAAEEATVRKEAYEASAHLDRGFYQRVFAKPHRSAWAPSPAPRPGFVSSNGSQPPSESRAAAPAVSPAPHAKSAAA